MLAGAALTLTAAIAGVGGLLGFFGDIPVKAAQMSWAAGWTAYFLMMFAMPRPDKNGQHDGWYVTTFIVSSLGIAMGTLTYGARVIGTRMLGQPDPWPPIILHTIGGLAIQSVIVGLSIWYDEGKPRP